MGRRLKYAIGILAALVVVMLVVDYALVRSKEARLSSTVSELGGHMGSIPAWPLGTEYRITFERALDDNELERLKIANRMRGSVGIAFRNVELSHTEKASARLALPACHFFVLRDDNMRPMGGG